MCRVTNYQIPVYEFENLLSDSVYQVQVFTGTPHGAHSNIYVGIVHLLLDLLIQILAIIKLLTLGVSVIVDLNI